MFNRVLHLPDWVDLPFLFIFAACAWIGVLLQRRAKRRGDPEFVPPTAARAGRITWLLLIVLFLSCAATPFVLPYTGITLPFPQLVIVAIISFVVCAVLVIVVRRRSEKA
jgi:hypothetical protein